MIIQFTEGELKSLMIQPLERWERSSAYLEEREQVWTAEMEKVIARHDHMWNGEIYTLEEIVPSAEQVTFRVSTGEFKDAIFRQVKGHPYVVEKYGPDYFFRFMTVDCVPVTQDGKFVFGIRGDWAGGGTHPVGIIGGGINKDEMEIQNFSDICRFMQKEITEETAIQCSSDELKLYALVSQDGIYSFMFNLHLLIHSSQIDQFHRDGEFSQLVAWNEQEALETKLPVSRTFQRWLTHLKQL
jgi:hypothetical protein